MNSLVTLFIDQRKAGVAPVPGNKSLADQRTDILERSQDQSLTQPSQRQGGVEVGTGNRNRARHVSSHLLLLPAGPGHVIRRSALQRNLRRHGISLLSPDRRDLLTPLVYVQDVGAASSSSKDTGIEQHRFFENTPCKKRVKTPIFTKMSHSTAGGYCLLAHML